MAVNIWGEEEEEILVFRCAKYGIGYVGENPISGDKNEVEFRYLVGSVTVFVTALT